MGRLTLAVACGALLAGTAAHAQTSGGVSVGGYQEVNVFIPDLPSFSTSKSGSNGAINGAYTTPSVPGAAGGAYDTFITTTPSTVSFEAANTVVGPRVTSISTTAVDLTFTNGANSFANGVLASSITPAGLGFYVASVGSNSCLYTGCSSQGAAGFTSLTSTIRDGDFTSYELGSVSVKFQVFRSGNDGPVYDVQGTMRLFANSDGFWVDDEDLVSNLGFLDGFGKSTADGSTKAYGYAWDGKEIEVNFGSLDPFETTTLTYLTQVTSTASAECTRSLDCLIAFSGFGDPIGRGGGIDSADEALTAFDFSSFLSVLDGPALAAGGGPIGGVQFTGVTFQLPTFDPATGRVTFAVAAAAAPEPASWAMMILGFGVVGTMIRRRRVAGARA